MKDLRIAVYGAGAFCAKYAAGRPYFMVRAKTPQLVLDEIDKLMEQLGMN